MPMIKYVRRHRENAIRKKKQRRKQRIHLLLLRPSLRTGSKIHTERVRWIVGQITL